MFSCVFHVFHPTSVFLPCLCIFIDLLMDQVPRKVRAECPYGNEIYAVCVSNNCKHPAVLCEEGFGGSKECGHFHDNCMKVLWSKVTTLVGHNPHVCCPDFHYIIDKMDSTFINLLAKIRAEHEKFNFWVKTYGYSLEVMKFIKNISEHNYDNFTGHQLHSVVTEILNSRRLQLIPAVNQNEIILMEDDILNHLSKASDIYLKPGLRKEKPSMIEIPPSVPLDHINSKIVKELALVKSFFVEKVDKLELLFRASERKFDIREFHRTCDGKTNTIVFIETEFGKVIGGYTPIAWSSNKKHWSADKTLKSFIFSLSMREKFSLNLAQFAIANNPEKGPIFGCCDICVFDKANKERCNAQFPISYNNTKYVRSPDTCFSFTGHPKGKFLIKDWEVFQVEFA